MMQLLYEDKRETNEPIQVSVNWVSPNERTGTTDYFIESTTNKDDADNVTHHTLSFYGTTFVKAKATEKAVVEVHELNGKRSVLETGNYSKEKLVKKLMLKVTIAVSHNTDNYYITKEDWTEDSGYNITDKRSATVAVDSITYDATYDHIKMKTHRDVFGALIELNSKAIYKNPTVSLLLRFIEYGSSNYIPVFLEWFEEQFINPKDKYHAEFGSAFKLEYRQLKEKAKTNTGIPSTSPVTKEQSLLCGSAKQEPTTEPVVNKPQKVIEAVDTPLTHNSTLKSRSVPLPDPIDLLSEELASTNFFEDDEKTYREEIKRYIAWRRGQPEFRRKLLEAYKGRCVITGCSSEEALEAAHIEPYSKTKNNDPTNGLLLRADIHTLFDCDLIGIDPDTMKVCIAPNLVDYHKDFNDKLLRLPKHLHLDIEALRVRYKEYQKRSGGYNKP